MKRKIKMFIIKTQMKIIYALKVIRYPSGTVLMHKGKEVNRLSFILYGWKMFDDLIK